MPPPAACRRTASRRWTCPNVKCILNGSEPISAATVRRFNEAFGPYGFKPQAIKPSYGLAEATLFVSTTPMRRAPEDRLRRPRRAEQRHRFVEVPDDSPQRRRAGGRGQGRDRRVGSHRRRRDRHRAARRPDRRGLDQRSEHGHRLLGQAGGDGRHFPQHPQVADQPVARRTARPTTRRGCAPATRRLPRRRALHHRPRQGSGDHRRPQPLPAGPRVLRAGGDQGAAHRLRRGVLGAREPAARRGVRRTRTPVSSAIPTTPPSSW